MSFNQSWILTKVEYAADFCKLKQETHDKGSSLAFSWIKNFIIAYRTKILVIKYKNTRYNLGTIFHSQNLYIKHIPLPPES